MSFGMHWNDHPSASKLQVSILTASGLLKDLDCSKNLTSVFLALADRTLLKKSILKKIKRSNRDFMGFG